ncbi:MAG: hypothetical protein RR510_08935 [Morganella sp. (in: enterobacteria)]
MKNSQESNCEFIPKITDFRIATDSPGEAVIVAVEFSDVGFNSETHKVEETTKPLQHSYMSRDTAKKLHTQLSEYLDNTKNGANIKHQRYLI